MAEAFGIAYHELVSLDFRFGSKPEVSNGHENVCFPLNSGRKWVHEFESVVDPKRKSRLTNS